jgi:hypothetical protein
VVHAALLALLNSLADCLVKFREIFDSIRDVCDMNVFYDIYRPLLGGWHPDGIVMEGLTESDCATHASGVLVAEADGVVNYAKGPSAGQSTMFLLFDAALGVRHTGSAKEFQHDMLTYMPRAHRQLVCDFKAQLESSGDLRTVMETDSRDVPQTVKNHYAACVLALRQLRSYHLHTATQYLQQTNTGTGSSTFRDMLAECVESTRDVYRGQCPF